MEHVCYEEQSSRGTRDGCAMSRTLRTLREDHADVEGQRAVYRLCELCFAAPQYFVEVLLDEERAAAYIGEDASAAAALYTALVNGCVTPCTLLDIVRDAFG